MLDKLGKNVYYLTKEVLYLLIFPLLDKDSYQSNSILFWKILKSWENFIDYYK